MKLEGLSLLGAGRGSSGGKTFTGINPASGAALPVEFHSASSADVDEAARLADEAFTAFAQWPSAKRAALLDRIAKALEANAASIVERGNLETALPPARLQGELARTCFQLRFYGEAAASGLIAGVRIDHADPDRKPLPKPDLRSMMVPVGPVAVFGASNFPLAYSVAGGDTASALAAGCPVIVKAHPAHPGVSEVVGLLIQQAVRESGAPEGLFSLLFDAGYEVGVELVKHPLVKAVGFTGSRHGGRALMDIAAARPEPIPVYAEMSSINPVFILGGALEQKAEEIAAGLYGSVTLGVGQFCTNPGLVFIEAGEGAGKFLAKLQSLMASAPAGAMLTSGICSAYRSGVEKLSNASGVKRLAFADAASGQGEALAGAALFHTDAETLFGNSALMHEVFGPSTLAVECSSREQMLAAARRIEGQLTATIHALPDELAANRDLIEVLSTKAGRLLFNGFPTGVEVAHAMTHGGPYPSTSDGRSTSVGTRALERFLRPVSYQSFPDAALPPELQEANPLKIARLVDGKLEMA
jgi:alpha-ketoglutaric semialdehyde dehydrogenase